MEGIREIGTIWSAETTRALRSPRVIVLLALYLFFAALTLLVIGWVTASAGELARAQLDAQGAGEAEASVAAQFKAWLLGALFSNDQALIESLVEIPLMIPLVFKISLFFLPLYAVLMGFDQLSGELEHRSIRYLAIRARRSSILFGKFLAQAAVLLALIFVVNTAVFAVARLLDADFGFGTLAPALLRFLAAAAVFTLAYAALTTLCSAVFAIPAVSLIANIAALFGLWLINAVGSYLQHRAEAAAASEGEAVISIPGLIRYLSPSEYSTGLLHPQAGPFLIALLAFALFAAAFLGLGYAAIRARDV